MSLTSPMPRRVDRASTLAAISAPWLRSTLVSKPKHLSICGAAAAQQCANGTQVCDVKVVLQTAGLCSMSSSYLAWRDSVGSERETCTAAFCSI